MGEQHNVYSKKTLFQINFVKFGFYLFLLFVLIFSIYATIPLLKAVIIAFIIAYLINPIVDFFERKQVDRRLIIAIIFFLLIGLIVLLIFVVKTSFPSQDKIAKLKETMVVSLVEQKIFLKARFNYFDWDEIFNKLILNVSSGTDLTNQLPALLSGLAGMSSLFIIIPFCLLFFLLNGRQMKKGLLSLVPNRYFEISLITLREVDDIFGGYIRGTLSESMIIGLLTTLGFYIIGFPLPTALATGLIAGIANAIPYVGPLFGAVIGIAICILKLIPYGYKSLFGLQASIVGVLIVIVIVQALDNVIVKPTVIGRSVNLHPLIVILGVIAGSNLFGFVGMLVAIPIIAIIKVVVITLFKQLKGFNLLSDNLFKVISKNIE